MNTSRTLDVSLHGAQTVINATKGNYGNTYTFSFVNAGNPLDMSDIIMVNLYIKKPDGVSVYNDCALSNTQAIYTETEQTLIAAGNAECMLQLIDINGTVWSPRFTLCIAENLADDSDTVSEFECNALTRYVLQAREYMLATQAMYEAIMAMDATASVEVFGGEPSVTVTSEIVDGHKRFHFAFKGVGIPGYSGVYVGEDTPPDNANVWIFPYGGYTPAQSMLVKINRITTVSGVRFVSDTPVSTILEAVGKGIPVIARCLWLGEELRLVQSGTSKVTFALILPSATSSAIDYYIARMLVGFAMAGDDQWVFKEMNSPQVPFPAGVADDGKVVTSRNGKLALENVEALPAVTSADAGKFLRVDGFGNWIAASLSNASGHGF